MVWWRHGCDPSHDDKKESQIVHNDLKKICLQNKKNYKNIKSGVMSIFIYLTGKNLEESVEFFLIMRLKIGLKISSLLENLD